MRTRWTVGRTLALLAVLAVVTAGIYFTVAHRATLRQDARTSDQPALTGHADARDESQASALPRGVIVEPRPSTTSHAPERAIEIGDAVILVTAIALGVFTIRLAFREGAREDRAPR